MYYYNIITFENHRYNVLLTLIHYHSLFLLSLLCFHFLSIPIINYVFNSIIQIVFSIYRFLIFHQK
jgi:hypothetical protein